MRPQRSIGIAKSCPAERYYYLESSREEHTEKTDVAAMHPPLWSDQQNWFRISDVQCTQLTSLGEKKMTQSISNLDL